MRGAKPSTYANALTLLHLAVMAAKLCSRDGMRAVITLRQQLVALRSSTLLAFHQALVRREYRRLFSSAPRPKKPGPNGLDAALIQATIELKSCNPRFGCPRIARIIS